GIAEKESPFCILIDEGQFLTRDQVITLTKVVDELNIPVIVYGLKNDYRNQLFPGSEALLLLADKIEEVKTVCWYCTKKATMLIKFKDGKPVNEGEQIELGGNDKYTSVCRKCYSARLPVI
ncbi:MAG: thymidine kinase, partial [Candidatus Aminicenantes bacterium]|nr:thymidine kinase [Candidatus Aminicenantes bacterium]